MVNAFIIFFLITCIGYGCPEGTLLRRITRLYQRIPEYIGIAGQWGFFAPDPRTDNFHIVAMIHLRDGRKLAWEGALLEKTSASYGFLHMRRRQWETSLIGFNLEHLNRGHCEMLLRKYREAGANPIRIELGVQRKPIPPVGEKEPDPPEIHRELLYTFEVEQDRVAEIIAQEADRKAA